MKNLWEYKLDLLFYGFRLSQKCYEVLKKNKDGQVNSEDYITTKGLIIVLDDIIYVNAQINNSSPYSIDSEKQKFILKYNEKIVHSW